MVDLKLVVMLLVLMLTMFVRMMESGCKVNRGRSSAKSRVWESRRHWVVVYMVCFARPILGMETIEIHGATWVGGNR